MPFVRITVARPELSGEQQQRIVSGLANLLEHDLQKKRDVIVTQLQLAKPEQWFVAGVPRADTAGVHIEVTITRGSNTELQKAQFLANTYEFLRTELGSIAPVTYIVLQEVDSTSFGYDGLSQQDRRLHAHTQI